MGVRVGVIVEAVVLVIALDRDEPVEQSAQIGDAAGLELHRGDRRCRAADEGGDQTVADRTVGDQSLNVACDVDDVGITPSRDLQFPAVNGHWRGR